MSLSDLSAVTHVVFGSAGNCMQGSPCDPQQELCVPVLCYTAYSVGPMGDRRRPCDGTVVDQGLRLKVLKMVLV